jgi:hypothetical protein
MIKIDRLFRDKAAGIKCNINLPSMGNFPFVPSRILYKQISSQTSNLKRQLFNEIETRTYRSQPDILWAKDLIVNIDNSNIQK